MTSVLVRTEPVAPFPFACNRATAYLSDGSLLTVLIYNDDDGTVQFRVSDTRGSSFTTGFDGINLESAYFSMTVDDDDNVHLVYTQINTKQMRWQRFTKGVGYTWTNDGAETIATLTTSNWGRRDIEVLEEGTVLVLASRVNPSTTPDTPSVILYARTGGVWASPWSYTSPATSGADTFTSMTCSIARDTALAVADYRRFMVAYHLDANAPCLIQSMRIRISDGFVDSVTTVKAIAADGTYKKTWGNLFSVGDNKWIFGGQHGHGNGTAGKRVIAYKLSYNSVLGEATPVPSADAQGSNYWTTLSAPQFMGTAEDGRLVLFSPRISSSSAETGINAQVCRVVGDSLSWGSLFVFQKGIGAEHIRAGANRNIQTRWCDVISSRSSDKKNYYAMLDAPGVPTGVLPANGSVQASARPTLAATLPAAQGRVRARWQTATDGAFTTAVKTTEESETSLRTSGATTAVPSVANSLSPQGDFYLRALTINEFGVESSYSASNLFTVSHAPSTSSHSPTGDAPRAPSFTFTWAFSDPYSADVQTAYQIIVELNSDGSTLLDTGKLTDSDKSHVITNELDAYLAEGLRWKIKVWDGDDVEGPWSGYHLFRLYEPAEVVITEPTGPTIGNPSPAVEWTFTADGRTQARYQITVRKTSDNSVVYQSELLLGDATSFEFDGPVLENETEYEITVYTEDSSGLGSSGSVTVSTFWEVPESPPFTVDAWLAASLNYVPILWDASERDADFVEYRLYRRYAGGSEITLIYSTSAIQDEYEFDDWFSPANVDVEWALVQVALRFDSPVESEKVWLQDVAEIDKYWLLDPSADEMHIPLWHVIGDNLLDEYEEETLRLINRGTKKDVGTRWGYSGTLTLSLRDREEATAHAQRLQLELLKEERREFYLRTPFGDIFLVAMGNLTFDRMPGVGARDFGTLSIPYQEVV